MSSDRNKASRRDLLRTIGRGAGLTSLAALGVALGARKGDACIANGACRTCRLLGRCDLPEARSIRQQRRNPQAALKPADERSESAGQLRERPER